MKILSQIQENKCRKKIVRQNEGEIGINQIEDEKLCNDEELEKEAEGMIQDKTLKELLELQDEIETNLA